MTYNPDNVTPRPWIPLANGNVERMGADNHAHRVARCDSFTDTLHIVHCVNNHEALVEALEALTFWHEDAIAGRADSGPLAERARAVLERVKS